MINDILFWMFAITSTLYAIHLGLYLVGANFYDIWQYRRRARYQQLQEEGQLQWRPLVSVVISAHNEEMVLARCLDSIRGSTYKNVQVVLMDDASADNTLAIARRYQRKYRNMNITVAHMSKNSGKGGALNRALTEFAKGELVMTLDADSILSKTAIERAVGYFIDPTIVGVAANVRIIEEPSVLGVLQTLEHMIGYRSKKFYSIANCEFVIGGVASTYRMDVLRAVNFYDTDTFTEDIGLSIKIVSQGNRNARLVYGADIVATTEGVTRFKALFRQRFRWKYGSLQNLVKYRRLILNPSARYSRSLTLYRMPMAVLSEIVIMCLPFILGYVIYVSITSLDPRLLVGAYFTITAYTMMTLWFDEHTSFWNRIRLSLYAPIMYFIFYIMDMVQVVAVVRCAIKIRSLVTQKNEGSTWVSPQRVGREVTPTL
ncbi:MAG TPA: glycosyltransferase [Candidatus Saccharimonadales bacterium]|nr:glycosyltransferase [Candidatus Saccharimonadales bacterium]